MPPQGSGGVAPTSVVMMLADDDGTTSAAADGRADVSQLVSELKRADRADTLLNSMIKINDVVDADEDGLLENPFATEVSGWVGARRSCGVVPYGAVLAVLDDTAVLCCCCCCRRGIVYMYIRRNVSYFFERRIPAALSPMFLAWGGDYG